MDGKRVIGVTEMVAKIKAALDERRDGDLMLVARTDARAIEGLEAAIERGQIYREAGADMIFVEALMKWRIVPGSSTCLASNVEGGKAPIYHDRPDIG
jgi:methylisocitrate lyase